ncbi:MAG: alpha-2-macroglobulin family protein [Verrucomicrobiales bacterium]|nr:alpha-2-macroglobulin family protein [Verrucomicrobiales bacterium]
MKFFIKAAIALSSVATLLSLASCRENDDSGITSTSGTKSPQYIEPVMKKFSSHEADWKKVAAAVNKGRPKSAIEVLETILVSAQNEENWAEAVKALVTKITFEGQIEGNKAEEKISRLEAEIPVWPADAKPILETVLAHWYWQFFQQNSWRFMQRTQTAEPAGEDILTWDLSRILGEIDQHFSTALSERDALLGEAIENYDDLLEKGTVPDSYRPTLYDFIAHEALRFYSSGEQAGAKSQDSFDFSAESPAFGTVEEFLAWEPETTDKNSQKLRAIRLLQSLLLVHKDDENRDAFIDADLVRLNFAYNSAFGPTKEQRFVKALERFAMEHADNPISARARADWANVIRNEGDLVTARKIAKQGADAFPKTPGGSECFNIVQDIESKSTSITVERVWNAPLPKIQLRYKNVTEAYFRIYSYNWQSLLTDDHWGIEALHEEQARKVLKGKPVAEWNAQLAATDDYQEREQRINVPEDLQPGFYFVFASHDKKFTNEKDNVTTFSPVWVSDLALVTRIETGDGNVGGFVLNAITGEPVKGAEVEGWRRDRDNRRIPVKPVTTDGDGLFSFPAMNEGFVLLASHDGHKVSSFNDVSNYQSRNRKVDQHRAWFFTDRALYRPGQTIQYKGLSALVNTEKDQYTVEKNLSLQVVFYDVNGQEISRNQHRTNDFGSFNGSFTAPRDRLMGRMRIQAEGRSRGNTYINVEEYKRPKFKVTLDAPKEPAKLDENVTLSGTATSYSGAAVDGAKVQYRVVREVQYPDWWRWSFWWLPPQRGGGQEISHGEAVTGVDGTFEITFPAVPVRTVLEEDEPTFRFTVHADVTDPTGETRSDSQVVNVGYTALRASLQSPDWLVKGQAVEISVSTETLDGEGLAASGTLKVYHLKEPATVQRSDLAGYQPYYPQWIFVDGERVRPTPKPDPSNPNSWELAEVVTSVDVVTKGNGKASVPVDLEPGLYRTVWQTKDKFGKEVTARLPLQVLDPQSEQFTLKLPNLVEAPKWTVEPGEEFQALWGTGYDQGRAYIEIEHRGKNLLSRWTEQGRTQSLITFPVEEKMRGGFTFRVTQIRENRAYITQQNVSVPWSNKDLDIKWAHHTDKLLPGQKETWTATVSGPGAEAAVAEIVAALYDESLDAYLPHRWMTAFNVFRHDHSRMNSLFQNRINRFDGLFGHWVRDGKSVDLRYRSFPHNITTSFIYGPMRTMAKFGRGLESAAMPASAPMMKSGAAMDSLAMADAETAQEAPAAAGEGVGEAQNPKPDLDNVTARQNLQETAFFFPHLVSNEDGSVDMEFTIPEALTTWKFFAFAHDADLRSGYLEDSVITQKDIMVQPNPPRFLREADELEFTVKVINLSGVAQKGTVRLTLAVARTEESADAALGNENRDRDFEVPAKESRTFSWKLSVPDGQGFLIYKAVASTGKLSDGETGFLPVLPRRVLVTESLPLPVRDAQTKEFTFAKLVDSANSDSLQHQSLTVQMVSNPSWYAVMALPYLMEYPHQCSEQIFNRLYANALGQHIANSDPKIEQVFEQWRGTDALDSPLEKNEDLKSVMLEETPWVRQGKKESEARKNVAILFDENRLSTELAKAGKQLAERQLDDGAWAWFPGGRANDYITLYITTGYGRLRHLGVNDLDMQPAFKSLSRLDGWIKKRYDHLVEHKLLDKENLDSTIALYLYCRSFYLEDRAIAKENQIAVDYFLGEAKDHWLNLSRQGQGHIALALHRFDVHREIPKDIIVSLRENSKTDEEMGMYWRDTEYSYWWYRAPVETQAMMIEAFDEVADDQRAVEDLKVLMLKQKQTQDWKTTKATADAVYALLLRGSDLLASRELVEVKLGNLQIEPEKVEAGTGFYEAKLFRTEVKPGYGRVEVTKADDGVAWGSLHWQYFESMDKITPHEGTPLSLRKNLYTKKNTTDGPSLTEVKAETPLQVGDELVVRLEIRTDRDMEYLHLKDQRGAGTEPVNVLSRYKYQDGLGYYETTRDTATHFFIDYLPKGTYVFEYSVRVQHRGEYQSGMANIQCMYAPEFNSHSQSFVLEVK